MWTIRFLWKSLEESIQSFNLLKVTLFWCWSANKTNFYIFPLEYKNVKWVENEFSNNLYHGQWCLCYCTINKKHDWYWNVLKTHQVSITCFLHTMKKKSLRSERCMLGSLLIICGSGPSPPWHKLILSNMCWISDKCKQLIWFCNIKE